MKISVITVTLNCEKDLPRLVLSLESQTDCDFEWVVKDGLSTDDTVLIAKNSKLNSKLICSKKDFGIYDALNQAILMCSGEYYVVVGADDELFPNAIADYKKSISGGVNDIVSAGVSMGEKVLYAKGSLWRRGGNSITASHAVGTLIKKDLHLSCGFYKNKYPNCADMYFLINAVVFSKKKVVRQNFVAGSFGLGGQSSVDSLGSILDAFKIHCDTGGNFWVGFFMCIYRVIKARVAK